MWALGCAGMASAGMARSSPRRVMPVSGSRISLLLDEDEDDEASSRLAATSAGVGGFVAESCAPSVKPYWMSVMPSPARDPFLAAWVVCRRYVSRKPTKWKDIEISPFHMKEKREPTGRPSM